MANLLKNTKDSNGNEFFSDLLNDSTGDIRFQIGRNPPIPQDIIEKTKATDSEEEKINIIKNEDWFKSLSKRDQDIVFEENVDHLIELSRETHEKECIKAKREANRKPNLIPAKTIAEIDKAMSSATGAAAQREAGFAKLKESAWYKNLSAKAQAELTADNFGHKLRESEKAKNELDDYMRGSVKKLGTEWAAAGRALQGNRDMDTDSFEVVRRNLELILGRYLPLKHIEEIKKLTDTIKKLKEEHDEAQKQLIDNIDKDHSTGDETQNEKQKDNTPSKKEQRAIRRKNRIENVDKFFENAISQIEDKNTLYSAIAIPPDVIKLALRGMQSAYHAGESITKIIEDAVDFISEKIGNNNWDKDKFRNQYLAAFGDEAKYYKKPHNPVEAKIKRLEKTLKDLKSGVKKSYTEKGFHPTEAQRNQIDSLESQIKALRRQNQIALAEPRNVRRLEKQL